MNLTPNQTIKGAVVEAPGLSGSMKDSRSINGTVAGAQSLRGTMKDIPTVDNTLSKEGYAADSKAVGEALKTKAPISHTEDKGNPHGVTASQVGARPDTWMPSASEIGARPDTWLPTASDVGAVPTSRKVNDKELTKDITLSAADVGARPDIWIPTAEEVGARPDTWMPTADEVGARPNTWTPTAEEVGARPNTWTPTAENVGAVPTSRTVNGKALSSNIILSASDVGAAPVDSVSTNKVFKKLSDIGITAFPTTMSTVASKMPNNSTLIIDSRDIVSGGANEISDLGVGNAGTYIIMRGNTTSRLQLLHIYGSATAATSFVQVGNYAVTPNTVTWVRALDNSNSNYGTASANNGYHTAYFTRIGRFVSCTLLPKTANTTAIYQEDITIPASNFYPAENTSFKIYSSLGGGGNAEVKAYTNGTLRVMLGTGVSLEDSSKTYCWITA